MGPCSRRAASWSLHPSISLLPGPASPNISAMTSSRTRISPPDLAVIARGHTIHAPKQRGPGEGGIARHAGADINGARRRRLGYRIEPAPHRQCPHLGRTGALQPVDTKESLSDARSDRQCTVIAKDHMALVAEIALDAAPLVMIERDTDRKSTRLNSSH